MAEELSVSAGRLDFRFVPALGVFLLRFCIFALAAFFETLVARAMRPARCGQRDAARAMGPGRCGQGDAARARREEREPEREIVAKLNQTGSNRTNPHQTG